MDNFVYAILGTSLLANLYLLYDKLLSRKPLTKDAQALLRELMRGRAVLDVKVLDAAGLFYRSPRG